MLILVATAAAPVAATAQSAAPAAAQTADATKAADAQLGTPPRVTAVSPVFPQKAATFVVNKWQAQLYGFAEADMIQDTREGIGEVPGNPVLPHAGTYAAEHGRNQLTIRNSRVGFRFASPEFRSMKASGLIETDFFGTQPNAAGGNSEGGLFNNAVLRVRHAVAKLETPYGDLLGGQYWELFGWQPYFHPNTVEIQGVPGQVYSRTGQFRLSETWKTEPVTVELAVAALRPPQRDADRPDAQAGLRAALNGWKAVHTAGSTGTAVDPAMIGVSGVMRHFALQTPGADPRLQSTADGWGVSVDALVPIIPGKAEDRSNALTATASWVRGAGIQDLYSGFTNGVGGVNVLATNSVDAGLVGFNGKGLDAVQVRSFLVGLQYYLPIDNGSVWVAGNYSQVNSDNAVDLAPSSAGPGAAWSRQRWADGCLFWDATQAIRFGAEFAWFENVLRDGSLAHNQRYQFSMFYLF